MNHDRRRKTPRPTYNESWLRRATEHWVRALIVLGAAAIFFFIVAATDNQTRDLAYNLAEHGQWVTSTNVQVHVSHITDKSGNYWRVDDVRAVLPDTPNSVTLEGVQFGDDLPEGYPEGWQAPTSTTGFTPPLLVRVLHDGDGTPVHAMRAQDVTYWTNANHHPEWEALGGTACLAIAALIMTINARRRAPKGHYKPKPRAERAAQEWADRTRTTAKPRQNDPS